MFQLQLKSRRFQKGYWYRWHKAHRILNLESCACSQKHGSEIPSPFFVNKKNKKTEHQPVTKTKVFWGVLRVYSMRHFLSNDVIGTAYLLRSINTITAAITMHRITATIEITTIPTEGVDAISSFESAKAISTYSHPVKTNCLIFVNFWKSKKV